MAGDELTVADHFSRWGMTMNSHQWTQLIEPAWWDDDHCYLGESDGTLSLAERMKRDTQRPLLMDILSRPCNQFGAALAGS